ncbi:hypothetical protein PHMEG_00030080 [Phytophthora megakarya]|uniref:phosphoglycerate kinase n=1 Tax=Phytophthora megakarya TaxID=4795 RepID=A0A225V111_9STRA|nr:hypothetical protein PHMEG_00030080 [Phytophthora megakarya]
MSLYRILHTKQISKVITHSHVIRKHEEKNGELEEDADVPSISDGQKEEAVEKEASKATKEKKSGGLTPSRAHLTGMWDLLVPAVEILQRKARRKCVQLLLPIDLIVGETSLEEQDLTATAVEDDDDDDEDEVEEETDEEEDDVGKKSRKRKASEKKSARQKRLEEPDHADVFEQKHRVVYEGERAHVIISHASSRWTASPERGWQSFQDVTAQCLAEARVTQGKPSVLDSLWPETEADDADEEGEDGSIHKPSPARFKHEWTFRAFDIGPIAMEALSKQLKQGSASENQDPFTDISTQPRGLIINGVCGAVEFHEFCTATKQLLHILQDYTPSEVFIAGGATASWLRQLETEQLTHGATGDEKTMLDANISTGIEIPVVPTRARKVIDDRTMRNARVLKQIVAAKPNPVLANLVSSDSI